MTPAPRLLPLLAALLLAAGCQTTPPLPSASKDGRVTVIFDQPDKFTDAKSSFNGSTDQGYLEELQRYIDQNARGYLADGQRLKITFTDIDMAGDFEPARARMTDVRVVKGIYFPRLKFTYIVTNAVNEKVSSGAESLTDMNFMSRLRLNTTDTLSYEKDMLRDWMADNLRKK